MVTQELFNFIRTEKSQGKDIGSIRQKLMASGWKKEDIEEAFNHVRTIENDITPPPPVQAPTVAKSQSQQKSFKLDDKKVFVIILVAGVCIGILMFILMSLEPALFGRQPASPSHNESSPSSVTPGYTPQHVIPVVPGPGAGT